MTDSFDVEQLAPMIHKFYCDMSIEEGWANDFPMSYDDLPEFMKEDNRAAAQRIGDVLSLVGLQLEPNEGEPRDKEEEIQAIIEQNLELLAKGEHNGWTEARLRNGWRPGPKKNIELREHHLFIPYAELTEKDKNKDRDSVCNYINIVKLTNYRIARRTSTNKPE